MARRAVSGSLALWHRPLTVESTFVRGFAKVSQADGKAEKKQKKVKKPTNGRAVSAYVLFMRAQSRKLRDAGLSLAEYSRQTAKEWATISEAQRQQFVDEAAQLKATLQKASEGPKKPLSAYNAFTKSVWPKITEQYPDMTFAERARVIADMWNNMSAEEKERRKAAVQTM